MAQTQLHPIWDAYPEVEKELLAVVDLMEANINLGDSDVKTAIIEMIKHGGKMLRPAYTLLMSAFHETDRKKMIVLAAAIETLHTASLVHDDIIDDAPTRRHQTSIQHQFGKDVAVYAGDYLFVVVFRMLSTYHNDLKSVQVDTGYLDRILGGELQQKSSRYNYDMTIDTYLKQINGKTAELFGLATTVGAMESGASTAFTSLAKSIGVNIGMAFQIMDDILDYDESSVQIGKPTMEDLRQGVYSAPLIYAMNANPTEILPLLKHQAAMTDEQAQQVDVLVKAAGGVTNAKALAQQYTDDALRGIAQLPTHPAKDVLLELTTKLLDRRD